MGSQSTFVMLAALTRRAPVLRTAAMRSLRPTPAALCTKVPAQPDVLPAGELVGDLDGVNGLRREEIEAELSGKTRFEGGWAGPPGTKESPIVVESIAQSRIVGIPSIDEHGDEGELKWFRLSADDGVVEHHGQF